MTEEKALSLATEVRQWLAENYDAPSRLALAERFTPLMEQMHGECETAGHWLFLAFRCLFQVLEMAMPIALHGWIEAAEAAAKEPPSPSGPA